MKFVKEYIVGAREMGQNNQLTNYGFLAFLEDVATTHSDTVGYGVKDIETKNRAWLLMDWEVEVLKRPPFGEKVIAKTWATNIEKATYHVYRNFEVYNESDELIATGTSKWVFFDRNMGKLAKIESDLIELYNPEGTDESAKEKIKKIVPSENYSNIFEYTVKRADIDINNHMHNLDYLNLVYEALPEEIYFGEELKNFHIMYKHQIKLGETVKCFYSYDGNKHFVTVKNYDENEVHAIVELW